MKLNTSDFGRKCQFPLMMAMGTLPITVLIVLHNTPQSLSALMPLTAFYLLAAWLCMLLPGRLRVPAGVLGCAGLMAIGLILLPVSQSLSVVDSRTVSVSQSVFSMLAPLLLCILLVYSLQFGAWPRDREIPFNWYAAGVIAHLFVLMISSAERRLGSSAWESASPILTAAFALFLLLVMLSMNRFTMSGASLGRQQIPLSMRRRNAAFTVSILAFSLFIAAIPAIARFFERAWFATLRTVGAVLAFIARLLEPEGVSGGGGPGGGNMLMGFAEEAEPGLLAKILEWIATLVAGAAIVLFAAFAVRFLIRKTIALLRYLKLRLAQYMATASQDYIDEITDTREDGGETSGTLLGRIRQRFAFINERRLSPAERIRYRYRLLLGKHPGWRRSQTARETLPGNAADLYEQARYSGREMTGEQAEQFISDIRNT